MSIPLLSADSHVVEPVRLWTDGLEGRYRDRAPRVVWDAERRGWYFVCDDLRPALVTSLYATDASPEEFAEGAEAVVEAARAGGSDPAARLKDMALDGVAGEVLYPSLALHLFWLSDGAFQRACFRAYNDWLADYTRYAPERLAGLGLISLWDTEAAVAELRRCHGLGLRGAAVWASAPAERDFTGTANDPFWQAAQELGMPVSMHCLTGYRDSPRLFDYASPMGRIQRNMGYPEEIQHTLTDLIFSGILQRFPGLDIVLAENDIGWIAYHLLHADRIYDKLGPALRTDLALPPSDYFRRQVHATFTDDEVGVLTMRRLGAGNFLWGSDYPHYEGSWPHSGEVLDRCLADADEAARERVTSGNCARLYQFDRAALTAE
ncbi:amidohydrolase family protein [Streptomyces clavuligerus]|uniref:amidohydrolase family protein n=1 Tax=Streptomyces clavuligerus TaxID=1901 RepID=UPI0004926A8B|nr:amidohydrolase family protein [Streptomyces clavuligerus]AXU16404.1 amidohydrolase [Streptomyces clavuligerus]MBY6301545.1 amidohydrolase [Streptomyces clavuligerus]QCS09168.1 amidohydrolase [Streptomyces clavuligerus]QPJ96134.1 amidohydrolase family protein [Streptomyces clavuligerus]QPL61822.1 amidohydrolase [Streptomyces clavuligerus]